SPRKKSNTDLLLDEALRGAKEAGAEVEKLVVINLKIAPCAEYYACFKDGECIIKDDMQMVYARLLEADVVILTSPVFFYAVTAQVKALIDRCQAIWARKHHLHWTVSRPGRKGAFIAVGATKGQRLFEGPVLTAKTFFDAIDVSYAGDLLVRSVEERGEVKQKPALLEQAFALGKTLVVTGPEAGDRA
ncbi:MAG: flavodoxin family protein, partial [Dehalococcoidia bacterium]|nr:flavodoxin family protein [Dehalococcoidia bacterium]